MADDGVFTVVFTVGSDHRDLPYHYTYTSSEFQYLILTLNISIKAGTESTLSGHFIRITGWSKQSCTPSKLIDMVKTCG